MASSAREGNKQFTDTQSVCTGAAYLSSSASFNASSLHAQWVDRGSWCSSSRGSTGLTMSDKGPGTVVICAAKRSPVGSLNGALSKLAAHQIGAQVIKALLKSAKVSPDEVSEVLLGQALQAGCGQNPARQAALAAGLPHSVPATTLNMLCGSGLRAVVAAVQAVRCGDANVVVCGGQESMSRAPHVLHLREPLKFGNATMIDSMLHDGLTDAMLNIHMGITAENVAKQWSITREDQDAFAHQSQARCSVAQQAGDFTEEVVPVEVPGGGRDKTPVVVSVDEHPRPDTSPASLARLRPAFIRDGSGSVTAGNASGINDGAACLLVMGGAEAAARGAEPLCEVVSSAQAGVDPALMGTGPIPAVRAALSKAGWTVDDVDLFELNEAFAAQSCAVVKDLGVDPTKVNVVGGAIALGHPIGASGARVLVTLIHALKKRGLTKGVAALCVGGGQGIAICVQRPSSNP